MSDKKRYIVGCTAPEDWEYIHEILTQDGTLDDNIPTEAIINVDAEVSSGDFVLKLVPESGITGIVTYIVRRETML